MGKLIRIPVEEHRKLKKLSADEDRTMKELIGEILENELEKYEIEGGDNV